MFGEKIKKIRLSANLNQTDFGREFGVRKQTVSNWENNNKYPSIDILIRISKKFSISVDYLLDLTPQHYVDISNLSDNEINVILQLIMCFKDGYKMKQKILDE